MKLHFRFATVVALSVVGLCAATAGAQQIQVNKSNRTLAITASGTASALADTANVHIGYLVYGPNSQAAYAEGSKISNAVVQALEKAGVPKSAIESVSQNLTETPQFELEKLTPDEQEQRRYQLRQSWTVKTRADDAARVLNVAVAAGANQSGAIDWSVTDENALEAKAAGKALSRARKIAETMAHGLGIQLGELIYASNQNPEPAVLGGILGALGSPAAMSRAVPLAIRPKKIERSATVYAVFAIQ